MRATRRGAWVMACLTAPAILARCSGNQNALNPVGPQAGRVSQLWWFLLTVATVVFVLVIGALLYAAWRARRRETSRAALAPDAERTMTRVIVGAVALTVLTLFVFLVVDLHTGSAYTKPPTRNAVAIEVIGHQWWWEVHYPDSNAQQRVETANEIHVPVGRPVMLTLTSTDVIHSFWAPNLVGKRDLIPGRVTNVWFQADTPGVYRGQCAEFCGHQHANMGFLIVAESPARFASWLAAQRRPAPPPSTVVEKRGQQVFLGAPCMMCHTIEGTPAAGKMAPSLTHIGSRLTLAAATLTNTRGNLAGWIVDPQRIKPGNYMPPNQLAPQDLQALLTYLQSLK